VRARGLEARVLVWSEHASVVRFAARTARSVEVSLLRDVTSARSLRRFLDDAVRLGARGISAHWTVITSTFLDDAHARGLRVYSWCETLDEQADRLHLDLDGIVTEWPAEARATLEAIDRRPNRSGGGAL